MERKIILHIPHSSKFIDEKDLNQFFNKEELYDTIEKLTDVYTDELFLAFTKDLIDGYVKFDYSRCYCDVERFEDDAKEPMSKKGMGVLYTKGINGVEFRKYTEDEKIKVLEIYKAHHNLLRGKISEFNKQGIRPLLIDCHSFSDKKYINDGLLRDNADALPDFCLGFNGEITDLIIDIQSFLEEQRYSVGLNDPYAGTMGYDDLMHDSLMIEINKRWYMTGERKNTDFYKNCAAIASIIKIAKNSK